jgi:hypothetical protein
VGVLQNVMVEAGTRPIRGRLKNDLIVKHTMDDDESLSPHSKSLALLQEWQTYAEEQSDLHAKARSYYKFLRKCLFLPATLLGSVSGIGVIASSIVEDSSKAFGIVFGVMSILSASLMTIQNSFKIVEKNELHDVYSDVFFNFANEIKVYLALDTSYSSSYRNVEETVKEVRHRFELITDRAPSIPSVVQKQKKPCVMRCETSESVTVKCC